MKAKIRWRQTKAGYALLGFKNVLQKSELPVEYTNRPGSRYWYVAPAIVKQVVYGDFIVYYGESRERTLKVGAVLSPDEWEYLMRIFVEAGERLADVRKMVEAGEEITMQV